MTYKLFASLLKYFFKIPFLRKYYYGIMIHLVNKYDLLNDVSKKSTFDDKIKITLSLSDWIQQQIYFLGEYHSEQRISSFWKNIIRKSNYIIDAGANVGYYTLIASKKIGSDGRIYSFEPVSKTYNRLIENVKLNNFSNIIPIKKALSHTDNQEIELFIADDKNWGMSSIYSHDRFAGYKEIAETLTIDSFIIDNEIDKMDLIKIDVEGSEMDVINGMKDCISKYDPTILVEINQDIISKKNDYVESIYDNLKTLGYDAFEIKNSKQIKKLHTPIYDNLIVFNKNRSALQGIEIV